jgi:hypothetical protein
VTEPLNPALVRAKIIWEGVDRLPVMAANQFLVQLSASEPQNMVSDVVLTVGYLAPPLLLGTEEEQREAAAQLDHVSVQPVARFSIPLGKAAELAQVLQGFLERVEAARQQS